MATTLAISEVRIPVKAETNKFRQLLDRMHGRMEGLCERSSNFFMGYEPGKPVNTDGLIDHLDGFRDAKAEIYRRLGLCGRAMLFDVFALAEIIDRERPKKSERLAFHLGGVFISATTYGAPQLIAIAIGTYHAALLGIVKVAEFSSERRLVREMGL
ncbi:MAG: hypothetical protein WCT31_02105 [Candidatus Micrarchaeia archaeon]|jgi:hypothetical protein